MTDRTTNSHVADCTLPPVVESRIWIVWEGSYYHEQYLLGVFKTKRDAEKQTRSDGFKFCSADGLFLNEKTSQYRKIHSEPVRTFNPGADTRGTL